MNFCARYGPHRFILNDLGDPLTFHLVQPAGQCLQNFQWNFLTFTRWSGATLLYRHL